MKKTIFISMLVVSLLSARQVFPETDKSISVKASSYNVLNIENNANENILRNSREEITLFEWDFESELWNSDEGWTLTESDYYSETHSYVSPNDATTLGSTWNLVSDVVTLPLLGEGELMQFDFWVKGDTPDTDGDGDGFLEDYYQLSIMDLNALAWHASSNVPNDPDNEGDSYWCADETVGSSGGYLDEWMQYLDTPTITVNAGDELNAQIRFEIEDEAGAEGAIAGSCADGWDSANVRISADGGETWELLEDPNNPYDFECGYGWIYNDPAYETGGSLNQVAPGWGGSSNGWIDFGADLSPWAGQDVIFRFAFGSDPAYNTNDQDDMTGFQVDNITVGSFLDDCDGSTDSNTMIPSGEVWEAMFYDYFSCEDTRPGACGEWEKYIPGLAFNGNIYHDISHLAGKNVLIKFTSRYDENDDGGTGEGVFIDDFRIYKESTGNYAAPSNLTAEAGSNVVELSWNDMNMSGTGDFYFHNNTVDNGFYMVDSTATGFAGTAFEFAGTSTVNSVEIYRSEYDTIGEDENGEGGWPAQDFDMEICAYGTFGALYDTEKLYDCVVVNTSTFEIGWNYVDIPEWEMSGNYIISYSFNHYYLGDADNSGDDSNSYFSYKLNNGDTAPWQIQSGVAWGITANISYESANVTYNVYRDEVSIGSTTDANYSDTDVQNDVLYSYAVSATYPDGEESGFSNIVEARPESDSVHEESWDDGTFEAGFNSGGSNTYIAVKYSAVDEGEQLKRVKWYQMAPGGAFYLKVWEDNNGIPGEELYSAVQVSGNDTGWNERDITDSGIIVSGDFWFGTKNFSSTQDWGMDTDTVSGNSIYAQSNALDWLSVEDGNLGLRVVLDCGDNCPSDDICGDTLAGDTNGDGITNILDVVGLVNFILGGQLGECGLVAADFNQDDVVNILDVVGLVSSILGGRTSDATSAIMYETASGVDISSDGYLGAVELTLSHDLGFELELTNNALVAEYKTNATTTKLIVVAPETDHIFSTDDAFEVDEVLAVNSNEFIDVVKHVSEFNLSAAYPNPFNPTTNIDFSVSEAGYASVKVYNLMGQVVGTLIDGMVDADTYSLTWDAQHLSSGVYMIKAESNGQVATQKIMLLK